VELDVALGSWGETLFGFGNTISARTAASTTIKTTNTETRRIILPIGLEIDAEINDFIIPPKP
jgi:hypothetical protein